MYRQWFVASIAVASFLSAPLVRAADQTPPRIVAKAPPLSPDRYWIEASFLYWTAKGDHLPALVTAGGTGILGAPGTAVLFGNSDVTDDWRPGGRIRLGYWFDPAKRNGVEAHFFGLGQSSTDFSASSNGTTLLARPFLNVPTNLQDALLIASPGVQSGQIAISETTRLYGAGAAYRTQLCVSCAFGNVIGFVGYRYLHLRDKLEISNSSLVFGGNLAGLTTTGFDQFATTNDFHGLDLGLTGELKHGLWSLEWLAKVAVGATLTDVSIAGSSSGTLGGVTVVSPGNLLTQPTNIGSFHHDRFAAVPEVSAKLGYQITSNVRAFVGYDFMYWSGTVRPGGAIDTGVNATQIGGGAIVGPARPLPQFNSSDYWVHGVNIGAKVTF